jgi:hypothetical protein
MRFSLVLALCLTATASLADGGVTVPLPAIPAMSQGEQEHLLRQLVVANVVQLNCPGSEQSMAEWALLTGSADLVVGSLGLSVERYDDDYYSPAFDMLDKADTCDRELPRVQPLIRRLIAWGGSLDATPIE